MSSSSTTASLFAASISPTKLTGATPENAKDKRHHLKDGKGFINPWDSWHEMSGPAIGWHMLWRKITGKSPSPDTTFEQMPVKIPEFLPHRLNQKLRATWLGHACYLVEFPGGLRVLFDPVFSERCSPFSWLGPKRYTPKPADIEDIPIVDVVVISHCHYDHLDYPTIMQISKRHPNAHFFCPIGNKQWFEKSGITKVTELDWWDERDVNLVESRAEPTVTDTTTAAPSTDGVSGNPISGRIGCLPCQHMSARTGFDKGRTLWASWSVESGGVKIWFGGDTGYRAVPELPTGEDDYGTGHDYPHCPAFQEIGSHRGPFDLALIPIGAYAPRYIMSPMHANPFDAVNIFKDVRANRALAMHHLTWVLTEEAVLEPSSLLKKALAASGLAETGVFDTCDIGESIECP